MRHACMATNVSFLSGTGVSVNQGPPSTLVLSERAYGYFKYYVTIDSPALTGFLCFTCSWVDRVGIARSFTSPALLVASTGYIQGEVFFYADDAPSGSAADWQIQLAGVNLLGPQPSFSFWVDVWEDGVGV